MLLRIRIWWISLRARWWCNLRGHFHITNDACLHVGSSERHLADCHMEKLERLKVRAVEIRYEWRVYGWLSYKLNTKSEYLEGCQIGEMFSCEVYGYMTSLGHLAIRRVMLNRHHKIKRRKIILATITSEGRLMKIVMDTI